jgi:hypothetical protein
MASDDTKCSESVEAPPAYRMAIEIMYCSY